MSTKHGDPDIDLYADDSEFNTEDDFNHDGNVDLYDDVISAPSEDNNDDDREDRPSSRSETSSPHRRTGRKRAAVYVGNLTWWTSDKDMMDALQNLGVTDVVEVKFFENRANGQSKGFCVVALGSESSLRTVMEKFGKKEIHGQTPVVTAYTRQNLNYFENQSRKGGRHERGDNNNMNDRRNRDRDRDREMHQHQDRPPRMQNDRPRGRNDHNQNYSSQHQQRGPQSHPHHMQHHSQQGPPPPQYQPGHSHWMPGPPPPQIHHMPPPSQNRPGMPPGGMPPMPPRMQNVPPPRPGPPPGNIRVPPPNNMRGPPPPLGPRQLPPLDTRGPPPPHEWERPNISQPPPQQVGMPPQIGPPTRPPLPVPNAGQGLPGIPPPAPHAPSPHINPAFFHAQGVPPGLVATSQSADMYNRPPPVQFADYRPSDRQESSPTVTEAEFEEIMGRNKTVSSSAIGRAVADASAGDYASAIETLVTAISLIKQSKVANDERCKILISSLQDTLHGIESKSYGSRSKERARSRERERSRERTSRREKSSRRDRSRSRDREYRDRSRERDRYHEDRYRDKDRDHDRRSTRH